MNKRRRKGRIIFLNVRRLTCRLASFSNPDRNYDFIPDKYMQGFSSIFLFFFPLGVISFVSFGFSWKIVFIWECISFFFSSFV